MSGHPGGILAAFKHIDAAAKAIHDLKDMGYRDFTVYSPTPLVELEEAIDDKVSPVRRWTLIGALTGVASGFAMTLWMSADWPLAVGGKPIGSTIPYVVFAFELMVLFGAVATLTGLAFHSWRSAKPAAFDGRFTDDMIGIFVPCAEDRRDAVKGLMETTGAEEVRVEA
jgi:hypothetical protein